MQNEILFFDSSALIKKFIKEEGTDQVLELVNNCRELVVSDITLLECLTVARSYHLEKYIDDYSYEELKMEIILEINSTTVVRFNDEVKTHSIQILENFYLKTLDNLQLASALTSPLKFDAFVSSDIRLNSIAEKLDMRIINPVEIS